MAFPKYSITLGRNTLPVPEELRRKLTRRYANLAEMLEDGWSKEELEALIQAPRTKEATGGNMPQIDGFPICGTSLMNETEKQNYQEYKKGLKGSSAAPKKMTEEDKEHWAMLLSACKGNAEAIALVQSLMPKSNSAVTELFGEEPIEPVSLAWLQYRHADGTRFLDKNGSLKSFLLEDENLECVFTKKQVEDLLKKCGAGYAQYIQM